MLMLKRELSARFDTDRKVSYMSKFIKKSFNKSEYVRKTEAKQFKREIAEQVRAYPQFMSVIPGAAFGSVQYQIAVSIEVSLQCYY